MDSKDRRASAPAELVELHSIDLETDRAWALDEYLQVLGHDLRSPLSAARGFASLVARDLEGSRTERAKQTLAQLCSGLDRLQSMLDGLLELGCIGSGTARPEWIQSSEAFRQVSSELKPALEERDILLRVSGSPGPIYADPIRFRQVLLNLVTNAIEHMGSVPEPRIQLGTRTLDRGSALEVCDNGRGICARASESVSDLIGDSDPPTPRPSRGLGLAIVRRIMDAHGGQLQMVAPPAGGTCFIALFPDP